MSEALKENEGGAAPNVTAGVDNNANGKAAVLSTERRKELADSMTAKAKESAHRIVATVKGKNG